MVPPPHTKMTCVSVASRAIAPCVARASARDERSRVAACEIAGARGHARLDHGVAATLSCGRTARPASRRHVVAASFSSRVSRASLASRRTATKPRVGRGTAHVTAFAGESASSSASSSSGAAPDSDAKMRVAISGASGFVGTRLVATLLKEGHDVVVLTRDVNKARNALKNSFSSGTIAFADPSRWAAAVVSCDGVVNLAGEPISTRWSPAIKAEIMASRIKATKRIADAIASAPIEKRPKTLINASAIGFYGTSEKKTFAEDGAAGGDYLSKVCQAWEQTACELRRTSPETRVVLLRLGIVLDRDGGALGKMLPTFQIFAGGPMGDGAQWFSWIHREDAVGIIMESLRNESLVGPVNVTAPNPVKMGEMCEALGRTLGRPSWLPVPDFAIQALLGEGATVVLQGQKVEPSAVLAAGYTFKFEKLDDALRDILRG